MKTFTIKRHFIRSDYGHFLLALLNTLYFGIYLKGQHFLLAVLVLFVFVQLLAFGAFLPQIVTLFLCLVDPV